MAKRGAAEKARLVIEAAAAAADEVARASVAEAAVQRAEQEAAAAVAKRGSEVKDAQESFCAAVRKAEQETAAAVARRQRERRRMPRTAQMRRPMKENRQT